MVITREPISHPLSRVKKTFVNVDLEEKKGRIESEGEEVKKLGSEFKRESYGLMLFLTGI